MMQQVYDALKGEYDRQMEEGFSEAVVDGFLPAEYSKKSEVQQRYSKFGFLHTA